VAGYIPRWFTCPQAVTHHSNNWARRTVTSLIGSNALPLKPCHHSLVCPSFVCHTCGSA